MSADKSKVEVPFGTISCPGKAVPSIEIIRTHFNTIYATESPSATENYFIYWKQVAENVEGKTEKVYYKKKFREKMEGGLSQYFETGNYYIKNEGNNFHFTMKDDTEGMALIKITASAPENIDGLIFQKHIGVIGSSAYVNNQLIFPSLYAKKPAQGKTEPTDLVIKLFKFVSEHVKIECNKLDKDVKLRQDTQF